MEFTKFLYYLGLMILLATTIVGFVNYKGFQRNIKTIFFLILFILFSEVVSTIMKFYINRKTPVYHFTCVISLTIVLFYFIEYNKISRKHYYFLFLPTVLGVVNCIFFQGLFSLNTNTLILRGFLIISLSLFSLYKIFMNERIYNVFTHDGFWVWSLLLLFYGGTYFFWSYIKVFYASGGGKYLNLAQDVQTLLNDCVYIGFGLVFFLYPKRLKN